MFPKQIDQSCARAYRLSSFIAPIKTPASQRLVGRLSACLRQIPNYALCAGVAASWGGLEAIEGASHALSEHGR